MVTVKEAEKIKSKEQTREVNELDSRSVLVGKDKPKSAAVNDEQRGSRLLVVVCAIYIYIIT